MAAHRLRRIAALLVIAGCSAGGGARPATEPPPAASPRWLPAGPHAGTIVAAAVDRGGSAAVSIDALGDLRLWTALDGSRAPWRLTSAGAAGLGVASAGDVVLVAAVLPGAVGYLARYRRDGLVVDERTLDPGDGEVLAIVPTADLRGAIVARADHALALVDVDGRALDRVELAGARLRGLTAAGVDGALAVLRRPDDRFVARGYRRRADRLEAGPDVVLPVRPADGRPLVVSPDGARLAVHEETALAGGGWVASGRIRLIDLADGADVSPRELDHPARAVGFTADGELHVDRASQAVIGDLGPRAGAIGDGIALLAAGGDALLGGARDALVVERPPAAPRFLAYAIGHVERFALSPDGARLAVTDGMRIAIDELDGAGGTRTLELAPHAVSPGFLAFLDPQRLLLVHAWRRTASIIDAATAAELASTSLPVRPAYPVVDPGRGWLYGVHDGGWWALGLDGGADGGFGALHLLAGDASRVTAIVDDEAPAASILDGTGLRDHRAAEVRARAAGRVRMPWPGGDVDFLGSDDHGRWYWKRGTTVSWSPPTGEVGSFTLPAADVAGLALPGGGVLVTDPARGDRTAYDLRGRPRWSLVAGALHETLGVTASADGTRLALGLTSGVVVLDAATGAVTHAACAWSFGAWPVPPPPPPDRSHAPCR